jgi:hypothetical protein
MGIFSPVVRATANLMRHGGHHLSLRRTVAGKLVGHHIPRAVAQSFEQSAEELPGCARIATFLDKNLKHLAALVHRTPQGHQLTIHFAKDFVEKPGVSAATAPTTKAPSAFVAELQRPQAHRFIRQFDATLEHHLLHRGPLEGIVKLPVLVFNSQMNMPTIQPLSYSGYRFPAVIISHCTWLYLRCCQ